MAIQMSRHNRRRKGNRRAHLALKRIAVAICQKCKSEVLPHRACATCGTYRSRQVIDVSSDAMKALEKTSKREKAAKGS